MTAPLIHCPKCKAALISEVFNRDDFAPCPSCTAPLQIEVYPALFRPPAEVHTGEALMMEGEASCFYHPQKKAVLPCEACGRFLCALCDCDHQGQHLCPACLESGRTKGKIKSLENSRTRYDNIALGLAVWPIVPPLLFVGFYLTPITAPMAVFVAIRHWKSPLGLTQSSRWRFVMAIILALLELCGIAALIIAIATS